MLTYDLIIIIIYICDYGGIGRRARLRIWCLGVEVRVLLVAPLNTKRASNVKMIILLAFLLYILNQAKILKNMKKLLQIYHFKTC